MAAPLPAVLGRQHVACGGGDESHAQQQEFVHVVLPRKRQTEDQALDALDTKSSETIFGIDIENSVADHRPSCYPKDQCQNQDRHEIEVLE
jgi:hypothetical protein